MSNDNLNEFMKKNKEKIDETFSFLTVYRIFKGIEYLKSNLLIHRDLKPSNILIDHDFIPYISDFETVKSLEDVNIEETNSCSIIGSYFYTSSEIGLNKMISYPTDIYSFGLLIYYLYEKEDLIKKDDDLNNLIMNEWKNIKQMKNGSEKIKQIYNSSVVYDQNQRITIGTIRKKLNDEYESYYYYLDKYFLTLCEKVFYSIIIEFIYEKVEMLFNSSELDKFLNLLCEFLLLKSMPNCKDNKSALILIDDKYYNQNSFAKAKEFYELAANLNNSDGHLYLADLYFNCKSMPRDYNKAIYHYEIAANLNNAKALYNLGNIYFCGEIVP